MAISTKRDVHKKYTVGGHGARFAKTDTLSEAKMAGAEIARKEAWRGKWNLLYITIGIDKQDAPGSIFYKPTGWVMYVPVRGSGRRAEYIIEEIKRRERVEPMRWVKRGR